jgi:hypothetical protein
MRAATNQVIAFLSSASFNSSACSTQPDHHSVYTAWDADCRAVSARTAGKSVPIDSRFFGT